MIDIKVISCLIFIVIISAVVVLAMGGDSSNVYDGYSPKLFGPPVWEFLHMISFNFPLNPSSDDRNNYKQFICSLRHVLPCRKCRESFTTHLEETELNRSLLSRDLFSKYVYDLHNRVNGVHECPSVSYEQLQKKMEGLRRRNRLYARVVYRHQ